MKHARDLGPLPWIVAGLALGYGIVFALYNSWVCDDAFISFRYARNFVDGLGLVYNAGERVEGYTNFLWVMLLALGMLADIDPILFGQYLGVGFFVATAGALWFASFRARTIPLAAIGFGLHEHTAIFATCGLETAMFTFLVTAGLLVTIFADSPRRFAVAGLALILATMTRPDGAVFYACGSVVVFALALHHRKWGALVGYALPFVVVYVPYFVWKFVYYGYPVPNTFYAKSASEPFVGQGVYYLWLYFSCYWYLVPALVVPLWLALRRPGTWLQSGLDSRRAAVLVTLFTLPFLAYVAWVGGDFMFSRFCLPVTPALLVGLGMLARGRRSGLLLLVFVVLGSFVTLYPFHTKHRITPGNERNVVEEKDHYPQWYVDAHAILGKRLGAVCAGAELRVVIGGAQAMLAWFGRFPYVVEIHGLTDAFIAHRKIAGRGRVGHEKALPLDHEYLRRKPMHMIVGVYQQIGIPGDRIAEQRKFEFWVENVPYKDEQKSFWAQATLLTYDARLMARAARQPGVRFTPFPTFLDDYIRELNQVPVEEVRQDLAAFDAFYFDHNEDPTRRRLIEASLK